MLRKWLGNLVENNTFAIVNSQLFMITIPTILSLMPMKITTKQLVVWMIVVCFGLSTSAFSSTDNTTLSFDLAQTGGVSVQVYSITGRLVKSINNKNMLKGDNTLSLDCDDLPNGTYIVKFVSGKQNETVKFIKM